MDHVRTFHGIPDIPPFSLRKNDCDDGLAVMKGGNVLAGYVYPDVCGGFKPVSVHGRSLRRGMPTSRTPEHAAGHLLDPMG